MILTEARAEKFKSVIAKRQADFTVILENVHDPHNIGAVMRSCDAVGIGEIYLLYTEEKLQKRYAVGNSSSSGTKKWVEVKYFEDIEACMSKVKEKYERIFATHMAEESIGLHEIDFTQSTALMFGNEHDGVSAEALSYADGNFIIPQFGMVQSLNISVACAVSLYEGLRQRNEIKAYDKKFDQANKKHGELYNQWYERQLKR